MVATYPTGWPVLIVPAHTAATAEVDAEEAAGEHLQIGMASANLRVVQLEATAGPAADEDVGRRERAFFDPVLRPTDAQAPGGEHAATGQEKFVELPAHRGVSSGSFRVEQCVCWNDLEEVRESH